MTDDAQTRARQGVFFALGAYTMWGIAPIYFKALAQVSALEIFCHRVIWSFIVLALLLHFTRSWRPVKQVVTHPKLLLTLVLTSLLVGANWLIFIWAIGANHILDASLGYYINPLFNVLLGMLFLGERLGRLQWLAVALAGIGVLIQVIGFGSVPYVALALATSFGLYGLLRKKVNLNAQVGLFVETMVLLPGALIYLLAFAQSPTANMLNNTTNLNVLLLAAGLVTTAPLLCFNAAATRLMLSTLGFFQYIGPSMMFVLAVLIYDEPFAPAKAITFGFIWTSLVIFSLDGLTRSRRSRLAANNPA